MQMQTDEYLTWLFIKHGSVGHSGAGKEDSLSASAEHAKLARGEEAAGWAGDGSYGSRAANSVIYAQNIYPMAHKVTNSY